MGEVGTNSADNPHADLKMNGGINGNRDDELEAMDIDTSNTSIEPIVEKNPDSTDAPTSTIKTSPANENAMELDSSGNSDIIETNENIEQSKQTEADNKLINENEHEQKSTESISKKHENGATEMTMETKETCDQKQINDEHTDDLIDKNTIVCDSSKDVDESDATVKVLNDPLSMDTVNIEDQKKRTNQSPPQSTENGTSATVTSSNDKGKSITLLVTCVTG